MRRLTDLERVLMEALWARAEPATARDIARDIADRGLAYATVKTVLDRMAVKGLVTRELDDRAFRYAPVASKEAYVTELMLDALDLAGDRSSALTHFARSVSGPDASILRQALSPGSERGG